MKVCTKCNEAKPLDRFQEYTSNVNGKRYSYRRHYCLDCRFEAQKAREAKKDPLYRKRIDLKCRLKLRYGITTEQYEQMFALQSSRCGICKIDLEYFDTRTCVDHCHVTGKVRGLLCRNCNVALGHFRDDPVILHAAIDWLSNQGNVKRCRQEEDD